MAGFPAESTGPLPDSRPCSRAGIALALLVLLAQVAGVQAALVERDWQAPADAALTYDTDTGLEWLDLTASADQSYNEVAAQLSTGGSFESFAFASEQQVEGLFKSADLQELPLGHSDDGPRIEALLAFWSVLWDLGSGERSEFLTANTDGLPAGQHWSGRLVWTETGDTGVTAKISIRDDDYKHSIIGSALVRPAATMAVNGDVNGDGATDVGDLMIIINVVAGRSVASGIEPGYADYYPPGAPDGIIDLSDLVLMFDAVL